jgi:imidazolonepropionase-like amidohydrolase
MLRKSSLFLAISIIATAIGACSSTRDAPLAITRVVVIDATGAPAQAEMTVIVAGSKISAIGPSSTTAIPPGAKVIDGTGKYLIPGLADMHVHLTGAGEPTGSREFIIPLLVANGITTVRDMGGSVELLKRLRAEIESSQRIGPQIFLTGPYLDGNPPSFQPSIVVQNASEAIAAVDELKANGVDSIKVQSRLQPEAYFAIASESKKLGIRFVGHVPDSITAAEASDAGQASIEHLTGVLLGCSSLEQLLREEKLKSSRTAATPQALRAEQRMWQEKLLNSIDPDKSATLVAEFTRNHTWQVPTFPTLVHIGFLTPQTDLRNDRVLRYVPGNLKAIWNQVRAAQLDGYSGEDFALRQSVISASLRIVGQMNAAGVAIMGGTDTAAPNVIPGVSLHEDLDYLVRSGLTPMQALQAATLRPAEFLGRSAEQGTIQVGKRADLVLLDANPLADIRNTQTIDTVVVNGRLIDRSGLNAILAGVERFAVTH